MLFPGCRIRVVESNIKGSTGPIVGSVGFVSDFNAGMSWISFNRVIWHRFGKRGKERVEPGRFIATIDGIHKESMPVKDRRSGKIEVIEGGLDFSEMSRLEFIAWAYALLRLVPMQSQSELRSFLDETYGIYLKKGLPVRPETLLMTPCFMDLEDRLLMKTFCHAVRIKYYTKRRKVIRDEIALLEMQILNIRKKLNVPHNPKELAEAIVKGKLGSTHRFSAFFGKFNCDAVLYPQAESICKNSEWVLEVVKAYKNALS